MTLLRLINKACSCFLLPGMDVNVKCIKFVLANFDRATTFSNFFKNHFLDIFFFAILVIFAVFSA